MPRLNKQMHRVNVHMTTRQHEGLKQAAADKGLPMSELLRRVIDKYLSQQEKNTPKR